VDDREGKTDCEAHIRPDRLEVIQAAMDQGVPNDTPLEAILDRLEDPKMEAIPQNFPTFDARHLTVGGNIAQIKLDGQIYTLRITRQQKLILTK